MRDDIDFAVALVAFAYIVYLGISTWLEDDECE